MVHISVLFLVIQNQWNLMLNRIAKHRVHESLENSQVKKGPEINLKKERGLPLPNPRIMKIIRRKLKLSCAIESVAG